MRKRYRQTLKIDRKTVSARERLIDFVKFIVIPLLLIM